jgi:hypothetical protein
MGRSLENIKTGVAATASSNEAGNFDFINVTIGTYGVKKAKPTFRDIEDSVGTDHLRAHYRMASHNVHANPKGVFFKLRLLPEAQLLLAGRSNAGLADPGHGTSISLGQVSSTLLTLQRTLDNSSQ